MLPHAIRLPLGRVNWALSGRSHRRTNPDRRGQDGPLLDPEAIPQLLNYLNVTGLPLGLVLFFGPKPKVRRVIRDSTRQYPIMSR